MERFLNVDWTPPLEDMLENCFIDEDRLGTETTTYKIITGNFVDPFKNIEEDYERVDVDLMKRADPDFDADENDEEAEMAEESKRSAAKRPKTAERYVPGITKSLFKPTRRSTLNDAQQATCLRVLLKFSECDKPKLTRAEREDLNKYADLRPVIAKEQEEFLQFAKSKWPERTHAIYCEDYVNSRWRARLEYFLRLPRFYVEVTSIPFIADKDVEVKFVSHCLRQGEGREVVLPNLERPCKLHTNSDMLLRRYPEKNDRGEKQSVRRRLPVSEDVNCRELAESNDADLVISSSGLNCLATGVGPKRSWILPVVVRKHDDRNVVYVDKPAPPVALTVPQKNSWVYKYVLQCHLTTGESDESNEESDGNIFGDDNYDQLLALEEEYDDALLRGESEPPAKSSVKSGSVGRSVDGRNESADENSTGDVARTRKCRAEAENDRPASYKLFTVGPPRLSERNELMKDVPKEYKILVRTRSDDYEVSEDRLRRPLLLAPKLEHQLDLGAEAVTLEEASRQWMSLMFRPGTRLARVRVSAQTAEVLQVEYRTAVSVSNEIKRLFDVRIEDSLVFLHNVVQCLAAFPPGRYVVRRTPRNGAFATVYKSVDGPGKSVFDTLTIYGKGFETLPDPPWIPLDKTLPTPMQKFFGRMPCLFYPITSNARKSVRECRGKQKYNTSAVRRSSRNT